MRVLLFVAGLFLAAPCLAEGWQWMIFDPQDGCSLWREGWAEVTFQGGHFAARLQDQLTDPDGVNILSEIDGSIQRGKVVTQVAPTPADAPVENPGYTKRLNGRVSAKWTARKLPMPNLAMQGDYFYIETHDAQTNATSGEETIVLTNGNLILRLHRVGRRTLQAPPPPKPKIDPHADY